MPRVRRPARRLRLIVDDVHRPTKQVDRPRVQPAGPGLRQAQLGARLLQVLIARSSTAPSAARSLSGSVGQRLAHPLRQPAVSTAASGAGRLSSATREAASSDVMWMVAMPDSTSATLASASAGSGLRRRPLRALRARGPFAVGLGLQVLVGALLGAVARVVGARVPAHRAHAVVHRAPDAVVGEGRERDAGAAVVALGRLDQALAAVADQVVDLDRRAERPLHLARDRLDQREVLFDKFVLAPTPPRCD